MEQEWNLANANGNSEEEIELRLWDYIDGVSDSAERIAIEQLLAAHTTWRAKYNELVAVHQTLHAAELEAPSMRFSRNVMEEIARTHIATATRKYINNKIIWGIGAFFLTAIAGFLAYVFSETNWSDNESGTAVGGIDLTAVDYSRVFNNNFVNAFVMLNIVLALILLDRYLAQRKKDWQHV